MPVSKRAFLLLLFTLAGGHSSGQEPAPAPAQAVADAWLLKLGTQFQQMPDCTVSYTLKESLNGVFVESQNQYLKKGTKWKINKYIDGELVRSVAYDGSKYQDFSSKLGKIMVGSKLSQLSNSVWGEMTRCPLFIPYSFLFGAPAKPQFDPTLALLPTEWVKLTENWQASLAEDGKNIQIENADKLISYRYEEPGVFPIKQVALDKKHDLTCLTSYSQFYRYQVGDKVLNVPRLIRITAGKKEREIEPNGLDFEIRMNESSIKAAKANMSDEVFQIPRSVAKYLYDHDLKVLTTR